MPLEVYFNGEFLGSLPNLPWLRSDGTWNELNLPPAVAPSTVSQDGNVYRVDVMALGPGVGSSAGVLETDQTVHVPLQALDIDLLDVTLRFDPPQLPVVTRDVELRMVEAKCLPATV